MTSHCKAQTGLTSSVMNTFTPTKYTSRPCFVQAERTTKNEENCLLTVLFQIMNAIYYQS